jgi:RecA/RadA recombinase
MDIKAIKEKLTKDFNQLKLKKPEEINNLKIDDPKCWIKMPPFWEEITTLPGIPMKRIVEFAGDANTGKTSLGMLCLVQAQKNSNLTILIDTEKKFSTDRFTSFGGNIDDIFLISENTLEDNITALEDLLKALKQSKAYNNEGILIVFDSIATSITQNELSKEINDAEQVGIRAKVTKRAIQRCIVHCETYNASLIVINQNYDKIGFMMKGSLNSGGKGLNYAKTLSLTLTKVKDIESTKNKVKVISGIITKIKVAKNHIQNGEFSVKETLLEIRAKSIEKVGKQIEATDEDE